MQPSKFVSVTDAVLVVEGKKLHVNKAVSVSLLSIPTTSTLCSTRNSRKNRMTEIEIKDVKLEDFETLISIIMPEALPLEIGKCEKLLELADRFLLPTAKRYLALFIAQSDMNKERKLSLADTYDLEILGTIAMNFSQKSKAFIFDVYYF